MLTCRKSHYSFFGAQNERVSGVIMMGSKWNITHPMFLARTSTAIAYNKRNNPLESYSNHSYISALTHVKESCTTMFNINSRILSFNSNSFSKFFFQEVCSNFCVIACSLVLLFFSFSSVIPAYIVIFILLCLIYLFCKVTLWKYANNWTGIAIHTFVLFHQGAF